MPVSSPSYFPPAGSGGQIVGTTAGSGATGLRTFLAGASAAKNTQVSDLIVVGDTALSAGTVGAPLTDANAQGAIIIGSAAATGLTSATGATPGAPIVIGWQAAKLVPTLASTIVIGTQALASASGAGGRVGSSVIIGVQALQNAQIAGGGNNIDNSVVIGYQACQGLGGVGNMSVLACVVIGSLANSQYPTGGGGSLQSCVIVGQSACLGMFNAVQSTIIGHGTGASTAGGANNNTIIGQGVNFAAPTETVAVGRGMSLQNANQATILGTLAGNASGSSFGDRSITIGYKAAQGQGAIAADRLTVDTYDGVTRRGMFFGDMNLGNLIVGNSSDAQRALIITPNGATNILQIPNGTASGTAPTSSGYFYSLAGVLHWVASSGADSVLSPAAGQLAAASTAYTNNAAAAAGTLGNAPAAGNPTKWIPINDNGTIRNVPAW